VKKALTKTLAHIRHVYIKNMQVFWIQIIMHIEQINNKTLKGLFNFIAEEIHKRS
jgi:hypothetical protein